MTSLEVAALLLHVSIGVTMVAFGLHQAVRPSAWFEYLPRLIRWLLPVSPEHFMRSHGVLNIILGAWLISGIWPVPATWTALAWWASILPFAFMVKWTIGLRDLCIICALVSLLLIR